jgi:hypothetical protein
MEPPARGPAMSRCVVIQRTAREPDATRMPCAEIGSATHQ